MSCANPSGKATKHRGFTLVEVMVSLLILSIVMLLAFDGLDLVVGARDRLGESQKREDREQLAWTIIAQDLFHLRARPVRDGLGDTEPAFVAPGGAYLVRFTRGGLDSIPGAQGGLQRVAYYLDREGWLVRVSWSTVDRANERAPTEQRLVADVSDVRFEVLDDVGEWGLSWPPAGTNMDSARLPRAVQFEVRFTDGRSFRSLMPGTYAAELAGL